MTRDQIGRYFNLGKKRNANRVLHNLKDFLTSHRSYYETIYYLNGLGKVYVECEKVRKKGGHMQHVIMRNETWLFYKSPHDWKNEVKISDGTTSIVADSVFSSNGFKHFLEVDNTQTIKENREKIKRYQLLFESVANQIGYYPTLVWITTTELRRKQLEDACRGLKFRVYTFNEIKGGN